MVRHPPIAVISVGVVQTQEIEGGGCSRGIFGGAGALDFVALLDKPATCSKIYTAPIIPRFTGRKSLTGLISLAHHILRESVKQLWTKGGREW